MYIAVMKPITSICLILIAVACMPLRAADGEPVVVKSSSVSNNVVSLRAEIAGKKTAFTCFVDSPQCSIAQPGGYVMVRAEVGEAIYNDCTNVVLYKSSPSSGAREKVGVYCWLNDDCYMIDCTSVRVQTFGPFPDKTVGQSKEILCWETAMAQSDMNRCADLDAREADADLNHVYQALLSKLKSNDNATKKLRVAQRAWVAFRGAHLQELFPAEDKQREYGTIYPMCYAQVARAMTIQRTAQLRAILDDKDPCDTSTSSGK